mmetsp:Transcript_40755/g.46907  ORF Transcript_40755/g.46907 Transcript_40755/m.46907 type:complete len:201 (-) Transcript_40755:36-638(-)
MAPSRKEVTMAIINAIKSQRGSFNNSGLAQTNRWMIKSSLREDLPSFLGRMILLAISGMDVAIHPVENRNGALSPGMIKEHIEHELICEQTFCGHSNSCHRTIFGRFVGTVHDGVHTTSHNQIASEVEQFTPQKWFTIETVCARPHRVGFCPKIQYNHMLIVDSTKMGFNLFWTPEFWTEMESPSLENPDGIWVYRLHGS